MNAMLFLWACQQPQMLDPLAQPDVAVEVGVEKKAVSVDEDIAFELRISTREGWSYEPFDLDFGTLDAQEIEAVVEGIPEGEQAVFRYSLSGTEGSYVLEPQAFVFSGPEGQEVERETPRLFVDIGAGAPSSTLEGLFELPPAPESPWPKRIVGALLGLLVFALAVFLWRRRSGKEVPPVPLVRADIEALEAWSSVYGQPGLDDHARALLLSQIYRRYLERVFVLPASAFTTAEVLRSVKGELHEDQWGQSRRLLTATDRIKYARRGGGKALFEALDQDFRELIATTRWRVETEEGSND